MRSVLVLAVFAAGLAGCSTQADHAVPNTGASESGGANQPMVPAATTASAAGSATSYDAADVSFAQMMIPHHRQGLQMAALAPTRAKDTQVKDLAGKIAAAQGPEIATMTAMLKTWGKPATAPSGMTMAGGSMPGLMSPAAMNQLSAVSGADFDQQFLTMMVAHHAGAVQMAKDELAKGQNAGAKKLAQSMITSQQAEIATMQKLLTQQ